MRKIIPNVDGTVNVIMRVCENSQQYPPMADTAEFNVLPREGDVIPGDFCPRWFHSVASEQGWKDRRVGDGISGYIFSPG